MTFLELCQALQREAVFPGADISAVTGQTGEYQKLVRWVQRAWEEIQVEREWRFRWVPFSQALTSGSSSFDLFSLLGVTGALLTTQPLTLEHPTTGKKRQLEFMDWYHYNRLFAASDATTEEGWPLIITQQPDDDIVFNRVLDENYTLAGAYLKAPQELAANTDVPEMPEQYHQAILYRALKKYAEFEEAGPLYQTASYNDSMWSDRMHRDLRPRILLGHQPLA